MVEFRAEFLSAWQRLFPVGMSGGGDPEVRLREVLRAWYGVADIADVTEADMAGRDLCWLRSIDIAAFGDDVNEA